MNKNAVDSFLKRTLLIFSLLSIFTLTQCSKQGQPGAEGPTGPQGPQGAQGPQGIAGVDGATILYGDGSPTNTAGKSGDFYLDLAKSILYGPKTSDGWKETGLNLRGADGTNGVDGTNGKDGTDGTNGVDGTNGKDGTNGTNGADGTNGKDGTNGTNGTNGVDGASMLGGDLVPTSSDGKIGDFYFNKGNMTIYGPKTSAGWGIPVNMRASSLSGKKLVTIGDSMTALCLWQPFLTQATGMIWSKDETLLGVNGNPKMGMVNSTVAPLIVPGSTGGYAPGRGPGQSIYARATSVQKYKPDIIILWGGQNDGAQDPNYDLFTTPYSGNDVISGSVDQPTFIASYKGTLVRLIRDNPTAQIYAMTLLYNGLTGEPNQANYGRAESINKIIREVCKMYSVPVIDLFSEVGITPLNSYLYFSDDIHPNLNGCKKIADVIFKRIG
jgi:hypothetical protein